MRWLAIGALVAGVALSVTVPTATASAEHPGQSAQTKGRWTFLYYVDGDNNLEADLVEDMTRMAAAHAARDVRVIALIDRTAEDTSHKVGPNDVVPDGNLGSIPNFADAKLVQVENGDFKVLQEKGEIDMGDPQTWAWFLKTGMQMFPAEHYAAVINDHGGGIAGASWDDATSKSAHLSMDGIVEGVRSALAGAGEDKIDVLGFSACLMGHFDMAAKLAPYVSYLVASEDLTIGRQWDDTAFIKAAIDNLGAKGPELGKAVIDAMARTAPDYAERTMATIDLSHMGQVTQAVASFARAVKATIGDSSAALGRAQTQTLHFGRHPGEPDAYSLYDIGDLVAHLQGVRPEVQTAANALWEATRQAVLSKGSGPSSTAMTGMSIYLPATSKDHSADYSGFAAVRDWADMLNAYTGGAAPVDNGTAPDFESFKIELLPAGVLATGRLLPGTQRYVTGGSLFSGAIQPNGDVHYLQVSPVTVGAGDPRAMVGTWDLRGAYVTDGTHVLEATMYLYPISGAITASIPMVYQAPDGSHTRVNLMFGLDPTSGKILDVPRLFTFPPEGGVAELSPAQGGLLAPLVLLSKPAGGLDLALVDSTAISAVGRRDVVFNRLPSGAAFIEVMAVNDSAGNGATAQAKGTVP